MSALLPTYARSELSFARGEGAYLYTTTGERYLDFASGVAVTALGHAHPHLVKALREQAKKLWHVSNLHQIPEQARLGQAPPDATSIRSPSSGGLPNASLTQPLQTMFSSPIPAPRRWSAPSRLRAATTSRTVRLSTIASSRSKAPFMAARWPPSQPEARQSTLKALALRRMALIRSRLATSRR